jgi:hypothetical protein
MSVYDARFLMATIRKNDEIEAEPLTVYEHKGNVHLVLDDGSEIIIDQLELLEAASSKPAQPESAFYPLVCDCPECERLRQRAAS